jgi:hypothetical protein
MNCLWCLATTCTALYKVIADWLSLETLSQPHKLGGKGPQELDISSAHP